MFCLLSASNFTVADDSDSSDVNYSNHTLYVRDNFIVTTQEKSGRSASTQLILASYQIYCLYLLAYNYVYILFECKTDLNAKFIDVKDDCYKRCCA